jgi:hypothetical protein
MTTEQWKLDRITQLEHNNNDAAARIMKLEKRIKTLEADLEECREYLEQHMDTVDGDYGEPAPNKAMRLVSMIDESLHGPGGF